MEIVVKLNNLRMASRKVRLVADLIRGKQAAKALAVLNFSPQRPARILAKLLKSALANAKNNSHLDENNLYVAKVLVDDGAKLKRWRPRSRGRAFPIQKKTCHITIVLKSLKEDVIKRVSPKTEKAKESLPLSITKPIRETPRVISPEKPKPRSVAPIAKPRSITGIKRFFRRKAF